MERLISSNGFFRRWCFVLFLIFSGLFFTGCGNSDSPEIYDYSELPFDELLSLSTTGNSLQKIEICKVLLKHEGNPSAISELIALSSEEDKMVQIAAVTSLGKCTNNPKAVERLGSLLSSSDPVILYNVQTALLENGSKDAMKLLIEKCSEPSFFSDVKEILSKRSAEDQLYGNLLELSASSSLPKDEKLFSLQLLNGSQLNKQQIKMLFAASKSEKDQSVSREILKLARLKRTEFIQKEEQSLASKNTSKTEVVHDKSSSSSVDEESSQRERERLAQEEAERAKLEKLQRQKAEEAEAKAREAKAREAKAREAKAREAKAREAKAREAEAKVRARETRIREHQARYGWYTPSELLQSFVSNARKYMRSGGDRDVAIDYYNSGVKASARGDSVAATEMYTAAVNEMPEFYEGHYALAMEYRKLGKYEQTIHHLSQCLLLKPMNSDIYYRIGSAYESMGEKEKGHGFFLLAAEKDTRNGEYPYRAGLIAFQKKDLVSALALLRRADTLSPGRGDILFNIAALYLNLGDTVNARTYALKAQARGSDVTQILSALQ